jgi:hypothetical protein
VEEAVGGDLQRLLETRTLRLKKLGIPCKHVRPIPVCPWYAFGSRVSGSCADLSSGLMLLPIMLVSGGIQHFVM